MMNRTIANAPSAFRAPTSEEGYEAMVIRLPRTRVSADHLAAGEHRFTRRRGNVSV